MAKALMTVNLKIFDDELLSRSKSGTVWARIYFQFDDQTFPEKGWSDLALAFVNAWLEALMRISADATRREKVHFMDGPLAVEVSINRTGEANLDFIHKNIVTHTAIARIDQLLRNGLSAAEELILICKRRGWSTDSDYFQLEANVQRGVKLLPA